LPDFSCFRRFIRHANVPDSNRDTVDADDDDAELPTFVVARRPAGVGDAAASDGRVLVVVIQLCRVKG
jgi:hypothetical protein